MSGFVVTIAANVRLLSVEFTGFWYLTLCSLAGNTNVTGQIAASILRISPVPDIALSYILLSIYYIEDFLNKKNKIYFTLACCIFYITEFLNNQNF